MRRLMLLVALVSLLANCNFFFPFAPDQVCETLIRAQCRFAFNCCNATERQDLLLGFEGFRSEGDCINELLEERGVCLNERSVQDANNQGRFTYDAALAERCLKPAVDALNACNADFILGDGAGDIAEECEVEGFAFGTGKVAAGEACFENFECADPGSICDPFENDPEAEEFIVTEVGACLAPAKIGEDCGPDGSDGFCEPGSFCDFAEEECVALKDNGEDCFIDAECLNEFCNNLVAVPECDDKLDDGEECLENNDCVSDFCEFNVEDNESFCAQPPDVVVNACQGLQQDDTKF
jgi:hypothetical protein